MKDGSHNGHSHPLDKMTPLMQKRKKVKIFDGFTCYVGYSSTMRKLLKKRHKRKQREYNKKLINCGVL